MKQGWLAVWRRDDGLETHFVKRDGTKARINGISLCPADGGVRIDDVVIKAGRAGRVDGNVFVCVEANVSSNGIREVRMGRMVGASDAIVGVMYWLAAATLSMEPVLVLGESGTGKELAAAYLGQVAGGLHAVNMAAVPPDLAEAELFGWARGAFTGAVESRAGALEAARGGVLFLDELAEAPAWVQAKLLRAIDSRSFRRLGTTRDVKLEARVVAATNVEPVDAISDGRLRLDLLERLACHVIRLPPLRSRPADIPCLVCRFSRTFSAGVRERSVNASPEVIDMLRRWPWPGNVRELKNVVNRVLLVSSAGMNDPSLVRQALEDGRLFSGAEMARKPSSGSKQTRQQQIIESNLPRSTYYYRLKRGRIPADGGPRRASTCGASKT